MESDLSRARTCATEIWGILIGDTHRAEFDGLVQWLGCRVPLKVFVETAGALELLRLVEVPPMLVVFAQSYPGQFESDRIDPLRRLAPLARFVLWLGSWCEGESRSGKPCAGLVRAYWHQWRPRLEAELDRLHHGQCPLWGLPPTATDEERFIQLSRIPLPSQQGLVQVHAADRDTASSLVDVCHAAGYSAAWTTSPSTARIAGVTAHVWDVPSTYGTSTQSIARFLEHLAPAPTVALLGFPRIEEQRRFLDAGVASVVSKPYWIGDLLWELARVTRQHS